MRFPNTDKNLLILSEECLEVALVVSKIRRFGIEDTAPDSEDTNRERLKQELGDVLAMVEIIKESLGIDDAELETYKFMKFDKLEKWYHYERKDA